MDRRKEKTIKSIKDAFRTLIRERAYSEISVQDIIDEANVARATFYGHFANKEEVLGSISAGIFKHISDESLHAEKHHDFSNKQDFSHRLIHMLYHLSEDKEVIGGILSSESHDIFLEELRMQLNAFLKGNERENGDCPVPREIVKNHLTTSLTELILWWIRENGCKIPPEELADDYFYLVGDFFRL